MGTRPGDLDPGLVVHMMRSARLSLEAIDELLNTQCGLAGVSDTSADMRDLCRAARLGRACRRRRRAVLLSGKQVHRRVRGGDGRA